MNDSIGMNTPTSLPNSTTDTAIAVDFTDRSCGRSCRQFWYGRFIKDWSQYLAGIAGSCGLGATIYGIAEENIPVGAAGLGALGGSWLLLCLRVSCLKPKKELEDRVADLAEKNDKLNSEVNRLSVEITKISIIRDQLLAAQKEAKESINELERIFKAEGLKEAISKAVETVQKLQALEKLYQNFKSGVETFSHDLSSFNEQKGTFSKTVTTLTEKVTELDQQEDDLSDEVNQLETANNFYTRENQKLNDLLKSLQLELENSNKRYEKLKASLTSFSEQVSKLDEADDKFKDGTKTIEKIVPQLQDLLKEFDTVFDQINREEKRAQSVKEGKSEDKGKSRELMTNQ